MAACLRFNQGALAIPDRFCDQKSHGVNLSSGVQAGCHPSGSGLFAIAAERIDLMTQLLRSPQIAAGERHGQGELKLFKLVIPLLHRMAGGENGARCGLEMNLGATQGRGALRGRRAS